MIQFLFENVSSKEIAQKAKLKNWLKLLASERGFTVGDLTYIFCDEEKMLAINQQYLQHDEHTDIITFDYTEAEKPKRISGDVFISLPRVMENATIFQTSPEKELLRVMAHGALHLMGLKDKTEEDSRLMRAAEDQAIALW